MEQRPHFSYMVYELRRFRWILLFIGVRLLAESLGGNAPRLYPIELFGLLVILLYVGCRWWVCRYRVFSSHNGRFHGLGVWQGLVLRRSLHIDAEAAASVEIEKTPLLWLLGGRCVRVNTAGLRRRADAQLYLSMARVKRLFPSYYCKARYRAARWPVLIMSLTGSNAAVGLLTVAPFLGRLGRLLGERVTPDVVGLVERYVRLGLPPVLRITANTLVLGWSVAALHNFLRYVGFSAKREDNCLRLKSGLFTQREVLIDCRKITLLELRQTLTMRLFSLHTAVIAAAGYGRDLGARPVLIPAARLAELHGCLKRLLPEYSLDKATILPVKGAWRRYTAAPLALLAVGAVMSCFGSWWRAASFVWIGFSVWWLWVRWFGVKQAGFSYGKEGVVLSYPQGLALYRVYLPYNAVDTVTVTQSPFQRRRRVCSVRVRCYGEKKRVHRLWGLPYGEVKELLAT